MCCIHLKRQAQARAARLTDTPSGEHRGCCGRGRCVFLWEWLLEAGSGPTGRARAHTRKAVLCSPGSHEAGCAGWLPSAAWKVCDALPQRQPRSCTNVFCASPAAVATPGVTSCILHVMQLGHVHALELPQPSSAVPTLCVCVLLCSRVCMYTGLATSLRPLTRPSVSWAGPPATTSWLTCPPWCASTPHQAGRTRTSTSPSTTRSSQQSGSQCARAAGD